MLNQHKKPSFVGGGFFRSYGVNSKITLRIRMKSHWRRIQKKESVRRKVHALEKIAYMDVPPPFFFAARLRAALQREKIVTLKKVSHVTGDFFSTPYGSRMILELSYDKKQGLWVVLLRDALTMRVIDSRCGKKRNPTIEKFIGKEIQFVSSTQYSLVLRILSIPPKIEIAPPPATFWRGATSTAASEAHEPQMI